MRSRDSRYSWFDWIRQDACVQRGQRFYRLCNQKNMRDQLKSLFENYERNFIAIWNGYIIRADIRPLYMYAYDFFLYTLMMLNVFLLSSSFQWSQTMVRESIGEKKISWNPIIRNRTCRNKNRLSFLLIALSACKHLHLDVSSFVCCCCCFFKCSFF